MCLNEAGKQNDIIKQIQEYLVHLESLKYSLETIKSYKNALNKFISFLTAVNLIRLQDVTLKDLDKFRLMMIDSKLSNKSIDTYLRNVRQFFKYLEDNHQIFFNPASTMDIPGFHSRMQPVPSEEDMKKLLVQPDISIPVGIRDRALIETLYSTGVRIGELIGMNIIDVNIKQSVIKVLGKGNKERMVPMGKKAKFWIEKYIKDIRGEFIRNNQDESALFVGSQRGRRINHLIVSRDLHEYSVQAGIAGITPHSIRRACATHMLRQGAHPVQIQMLLGHSSMRSLRSYLQVTVTDLLKTYKKGNPGK